MNCVDRKLSFMTVERPRMSSPSSDPLRRAAPEDVLRVVVEDVDVPRPRLRLIALVDEPSEELQG